VVKDLITAAVGDLIKPMRIRWERMLVAAERETNTQIAAYQAGRTDAMRARGARADPADDVRSAGRRAGTNAR
jgi:hypothetical protein